MIGIFKFKSALIKDWVFMDVKDWRSILALVGQIAGGLLMAGIIVWMTLLFTSAALWSAGSESSRIATLSSILKFMVCGFIALLVGFGLSVGRRRFKLSRTAIEAESFDDDDEHKEA